LSLWQPESKFLVKTSGLTEVVYECFEVLECLVDENKITASRMFSMDKTSHTVVQSSEKIAHEETIKWKQHLLNEGKM